MSENKSKVSLLMEYLKESGMMEAKNSLLASFVTFLKENKVKGYEIKPEMDSVIMKIQTKYHNPANFMVNFRPETENKVQYANITFLNFYNYPEEKTEYAYLICNFLNQKYTGMKFCLNKNYNTMVVDYRIGFTKNDCGGICIAGVNALRREMDSTFETVRKLFEG